LCVIRHILSWEPFNEISEIWYVDASQQKKMLQKNIFRFQPLLPFFGLKTAKIDRNVENWQNPNRFLKFSKIF